MRLMVIATDSMGVESQARELAETLDGLGTKPNAEKLEALLKGNPDVSFWMIDEPLDAIIVMKDQSQVEFAWRYGMWAFTNAPQVAAAT